MQIKRGPENICLMMFLKGNVAETLLFKRAQTREQYDFKSGYTVGNKLDLVTSSPDLWYFYFPKNCNNKLTSQACSYRVIQPVAFDV